MKLCTIKTVQRKALVLLGLAGLIMAGMVQTASANATNSPSNVVSLRSIPLLERITLAWTNPPDTDLTGVLVVRNTSGIDWLPEQGKTYLQGEWVSAVYVVYAGPGNTIDPTGRPYPGQQNDIVDSQSIAENVRYYYRVFAFDASTNYASGADVSALTPKADKIFVDADATGGNTGLSWANAFTSLQTALTNWVDGKQIWVAEGVYRPSATGNRDAIFTLKANMYLYGGFAGTEEFLVHRQWTKHPTRLNGDLGVQGVATDNSKRIVLVPPSATGSLLDGFTIEDAYGSSWGGGISNGAVMMVQNCVVQNNYGYTGGMHTDYVKVTVRNTIFRGNHGTTRGGALQVYAGWGKNPVFENCLFYDNVQDDRGGAIAVYHGPSTFRNCAFINNSAPSAAAGNCAYLSNYGEPSFYNCILWDSGASGNGIWIKEWNTINESGQSSYYNCLMREDMTPPIPLSGSKYFGGSYIGAKTGCIIGSNPLFVNETGKDFHLQGTSPGIDKADTANAPVDDLDENLRPGGLSADIGPYEITGGRPLPSGILYMLK
jgi:hypothetical protein